MNKLEALLSWWPLFLGVFTGAAPAVYGYGKTKQKLDDNVEQLQAHVRQLKDHVADDKEAFKALDDKLDRAVNLLGVACNDIAWIKSNTINKGGHHGT